MSVTMICPNLKCGRTVVAPLKARGKVVRCAYCHTMFMVPANAPSVPESTNPGDQGKGKQSE